MQKGMNRIYKYQNKDYDGKINSIHINNQYKFKRNKYSS